MLSKMFVFLFNIHNLDKKKQHNKKPPNFYAFVEIAEEETSRAWWERAWL